MLGRKACLYNYYEALNGEQKRYIQIYSFRLLNQNSSRTHTSFNVSIAVMAPVFSRDGNLVAFVKSKVVYGQEPPSGDSTITECGINYQLLAVMLLK